MCAPDDLLKKIALKKETQRRKTKHDIELKKMLEKQKREFVTVSIIDAELDSIDSMLLQIASKKKDKKNEY